MISIQTIRELIGKQCEHSEKEKLDLLIGESLMSKTFSNERIVYIWQGNPIAGAGKHEAAMIFKGINDVIVMKPAEQNNTKLIKFSYDPDYPFSESNEMNFDLLPTTDKQKWRSLVQGGNSSWIARLGKFESMGI